ncbi:MAG: hypothetical protein MI741_17875 [Rhodospirillales bacterium]|nr:hypothetical protein [Rhodospirillales bacterium]
MPSGPHRGCCCPTCTIDPTVDTQLVLTLAGVNATRCAGCYTDPANGDATNNVESVTLDGEYTLDFFLTQNSGTAAELHLYRLVLGAVDIAAVVNVWFGDPPPQCVGAPSQGYEDVQLANATLDVWINPKCGIVAVSVTDITDNELLGVTARAFSYDDASGEAATLGDAISNELACAYLALSSGGTATVTKPVA